MRKIACRGHGVHLASAYALTDNERTVTIDRVAGVAGIAVRHAELVATSADEAETLYRLVDATYERRSLILTSNLRPARFDSIFPKGLATAAVDRLLHHAHVIVTEGRSHRLTEGARRSRREAAGRARRLTVLAA